MSAEGLVKAKQWLVENWPLLGNFTFDDNHPIHTTFGRIAELLSSYAASREECQVLDRCWKWFEDHEAIMSDQQFDGALDLKIAIKKILAPGSTGAEEAERG